MTSAARTNRLIAWLELVLVVCPTFALWGGIVYLCARERPWLLLITAPLLLPGLAGLLALCSLLLPRALGRPLARQMRWWQFAGLGLGTLLAVFLLYGFTQPRSDPPVLAEWRIVWYVLVSGCLAVAVHAAGAFERMLPCRCWRRLTGEAT